MWVQNVNMESLAECQPKHVCITSFVGPILPIAVINVGKEGEGGA